MVATATRTVEIEVDGTETVNGKQEPTNVNLYFRPLKRTLRGRFDLHRVKQTKALQNSRQWPDPIPGQRLALDLDTREAFVVEPLHDPEQSANKRRVTSARFDLPPAREPLGKVDLATFIYWMRRAIESGVARVVLGELPAEVDGTPQTSFFSTPRPDANANLAAAIDRMATASEQQTKVLTALVEKLAK